MKKFILFAAALLTLALTGCTTINGFMATQRVKEYAQTDKQLLSSIYKVSEDGMNHSLDPSIRSAGYSLNHFDAARLVMSKQVASAMNLRMAAEDLIAHPHDPIEDAPALQYIKAVKARGNVAKLYTTRMTAVVARRVGHPIIHFAGDGKSPASVELYDTKPVIMEFDQNGRLISMMLSVYQGQASLGANFVVYTTIYMDRHLMVNIENAVGARGFADNLIRTL